jgi:hypothetical protein
LQLLPYPASECNEFPEVLNWIAARAVKGYREVVRETELAASIAQICDRAIKRLSLL